MAFMDYLTAEGERLLAKSIADAEPIVFTKVAMGSGYLPQDASEKNVSELVSEEKTLDVTTVSLNDNSSIVVTAYFNNEGLTDGFYFREKGIYMKVGEDEVLGIYGNAGSTAEYIDTTEECVIEKSLRTILHMTSDELKNVQLWNGTAAVAPLVIKGITLSDFVKTDTALSVTVGQQVIIDKAIYVFTGGDQRDVDNYSRGVLISDVYKEQIAGANEHGGMAASQNAVYFVYRELDNHSNAKATTSVLGHVKLSDSSAVTDSTGLALPATEKNASISGTLANQISKVNSDLESHSHSWDKITDKPTTFTPSSHKHNDIYYTESEVDTKFKQVNTCFAIASIDEVHYNIESGGFSNVKFKNGWMNTTSNTGFYLIFSFVQSSLAVGQWSLNVCKVSADSDRYLTKLASGTDINAPTLEFSTDGTLRVRNNLSSEYWIHCLIFKIG